MKKYFSIFVVVLSLLLITGCDNEEEKKLKEITLKVNLSPSAAEELRIEEDPKGIVSITTESDSEKCGTRTGCSYTVTHKIVGAKEGKTRVIIKKYNFAKKNVIKKYIYDIKVDKDLNITETHTEE